MKSCLQNIAPGDILVLSCDGTHFRALSSPDLSRRHPTVTVEQVGQEWKKSRLYLWYNGGRPVFCQILKKL